MSFGISVLLSSTLLPELGLVLSVMFAWILYPGSSWSVKPSTNHSQAGRDNTQLCVTFWLLRNPNTQRKGGLVVVESNLRLFSFLFTFIGMENRDQGRTIPHYITWGREIIIIVFVCVKCKPSIFVYRGVNIITHKGFSIQTQRNLIA